MPRPYPSRTRSVRGDRPSVVPPLPPTTIGCRFTRRPYTSWRRGRSTWRGTHKIRDLGFALRVERKLVCFIIYENSCPSSIWKLLEIIDCLDNDKVKWSIYHQIAIKPFLMFGFYGGDLNIIKFLSSIHLIYPRNYRIFKAISYFVLVIIGIFYSMSWSRQL